MLNCYKCNSILEVKYMPFEYKADRKLYSIPNVKTLVCSNPECGERFYDEETSREMDNFNEEEYDRNRKQSNIG